MSALTEKVEAEAWDRWPGDVPMHVAVSRDRQMARYAFREGAKYAEEAVRANMEVELAEAWERGFVFSYGLDRGCTVAESHNLSPYRLLVDDLRIWNPYTDDTDEEDPYE